jgi:hypothetical protein
MKQCFHTDSTIQLHQNNAREKQKKNCKDKGTAIPLQAWTDP